MCINQNGALLLGRGLGTAHALDMTCHLSRLLGFCMNESFYSVRSDFAALQDGEREKMVAGNL